MMGEDVWDDGGMSGMMGRMSGTMGEYVCDDGGKSGIMGEYLGWWGGCLG